VQSENWQMPILSVLHAAYTNPILSDVQQGQCHLAKSLKVS